MNVMLSFCGAALAGVSDWVRLTLRAEGNGNEPGSGSDR